MTAPGLVSPAKTKPPENNFEFLLALFNPEHVNNSYVTGFAEDPTGQHDTRTRGRMWRGQRWGDLKTPLAREWNNYFCISTFKPSADPLDHGQHRRRKALHTATFVIVFDDVGQKVPWEHIKLLPSYVLLTSPGNCQLGYRLTVPEADAGKVERLIDGLIVNGLATDAKDPGMRGVTRYVRLPMGTNRKSKYGTLGIVCELRDWHPERNYTPEQIASAHGINLAKPEHTGPARPRLTMTDEQRRAVAETFLAALETQGLIIGEDPNAPGKWHVRCPWLNEHSTPGDDSGTAYFEPGYTDRATGTISEKGGFKCHHGHCENRHLHDVISWLREHGHNEVVHPNVTLEFHAIVDEARRLPEALFTALRRDEESGRIMSGWKNNAEIIMLNDTIISVTVRFNEFTHTHEIMLPKITNLDSLISWIITEVERVYECSFSEATTRLMLHRLLDRNHYDPLLDWAKTLAWDGQPRMDNMLVLHAGAGAMQPPEYVRAVTHAFMVGAACRVLAPGYKFDNMLILEGPQGIGKSTLCRLLCPHPDWAAAGILDVQDKDGVADLLGKLVYEVEELQTFRRVRDIDALKAFLSRTHDRVRLSYRRDSADYARRCVFIGTTNKNKYLEDEDDLAQRRFWPVNVAVVDLPWFSSQVEQVWAEALHAANEGEIPVLTLPNVRLAEVEQVARARTADELPWHDALIQLWDSKDYRHGWPATTTSTEVLSMLGVAVERQDKFKEMSVARVLRSLGYIRGWRGDEQRRQRCWVRDSQNDDILI